MKKNIMMYRLLKRLEKEKKYKTVLMLPYPKIKTFLRFDQIQEGSQNLFCAKVQGNVRENHDRDSEKKNDVEREKRERVKFRIDDRNIFSLRYRGAGEEKRKKWRACIYRVTLFGLFQYPSPKKDKERAKESTELVLSSSSSSRSFIKRSSSHTPTYIFSSHPLKIFLKRCRIIPRDMTLFIKRV